MQIQDITVEVRNASLARIGVILPQDLVGFKAVMRFNNVGSWELTLPDDHVVGQTLRQPGSGIVVNGPNGILISGPMTSATKKQSNDDPVGTWTIQGVDDTVILGERLAYPTPTTADVTAQVNSHDSRTGIASTVLYGYVKANIGSLAPVSRQVPGLTTATDTLLGSTVYGLARFDVLGELLSGLASIDGLGFDIRQQGSALQFVVFQPVDRSAYIRMDVENNTLAKSEYGYGTHARSRAIVGGDGEGVNRTFAEVTTTSSLAAETLWGRRIETFIDQRNSDTATELTQAGLESLADGGMTITSVDVVPSNDLTMEFGTDWGLGDKVTVVVGGQEVKAIVTTAALTIEEDGVRIGATVGQPSGVDFEALTDKKQTDQAQRVNELERKESPAIYWNDTEGTYEFKLKGGNVTLQIGQEQVIRVKNGTGATLANGSVVYPTGSDGSNKTVALAQANAEATSTATFGVLTEDITNGNKGFVTTFGLVHDINTSALTEGAAVWLSPTVAGGLTSTKPSAPNHMVLVGFCVRSHAVNGVLFVKVQNGFELNELHDVAISTTAAGDVLIRNSGNTGWQNSTLAAAGIATTAQLATAVPPGVVNPFAGAAAPSGYLLCDGTAVSRTTYATLFAAIGTTYGTGDGSTTFNVPNLKGKVPVGRDAADTNFNNLNTPTTYIGEKAHALSSGEMASHSHTFSGTTSTNGDHSHQQSGTWSSYTSHNHYSVGGTAQSSDPVQGTSYSMGNTYGAGSHSHTYSGTTSSAGSGTAHNNVQPYIVLNYIIKT